MSEPDEIEALRRELAAARQREAELQAQLAAAQVQGSGASAQGDAATAAGERAAVVQGNAWLVNTGRLNQVQGAVIEGVVQTAGGHFIGRDFIQTITQIIQTGEDPEEAKSVIALYLHALAADLGGLKLGEIDTSADQTKQTPLQLADVFVPLNTSVQIPKEWALEQWHASHDDKRSGRYAFLKSAGETRRVAALEAAAAHRELTLLGLPGSGKSTFGASLLLALAQTWQGHKDQLATLGATWTHGALLPIRVVLRSFAEQLPPGEGPARAGDLWDFIAGDLKAAGYGLSDRVSEYVRRIARQTGALFLLDGLDECGDARRRERVLAAVNELKKNTGQDCRFIVTARPYAWPAGPNPERGVYALADFDDGQVERFIGAWYAALVKRGWSNPGDAVRKRDDLLWAWRRSDLAPLARNPLLLTLTTTLHSNKGRLPDDRADLYGESVKLLMLRWNRNIGADKSLLYELAQPGLKLSDLREVLEELAFRVHEQNIGQEGTADIGEDRLIRAFKSLLHDSRDKAAMVVDYIEKRAGLLIGQGEKDSERQFTFPHRTFQEFLAACHLAAKDDFAAECVRLARVAPAHWQVVLPLAARVAKAERGAGAADELIGGVSVADLRYERQPEAADWTCAHLAANQLLEIGHGTLQQRSRYGAIVRRVAGWLAAGLPVPPAEGGLTARERAAAGDALAKLGDPRFHGPDRLHLTADANLGFVHIPAGPSFNFGDSRAEQYKIMRMRESGYAHERDTNAKTTSTPAFWIGRFPVTVAQFRAYVEETGQSPRDGFALSDPDNRPVRWVNWYEARDYCEWMERKLSEVPELADTEPARLIRMGWRIVLPNEPEWERAAAGGFSAITNDGYEEAYERANFDGDWIGDTSTVGCFPPNRHGLFDIAGNVWEWTRTIWEGDSGLSEFGYPPVVCDSERDERILALGGSWDFRPDLARGDDYTVPMRGDRHPNIGFRVVLLPAPFSWRDS